MTLKTLALFLDFLVDRFFRKTSIGNGTRPFCERCIRVGKITHHGATGDDPGCSLSRSPALLYQSYHGAADGYKQVFRIDNPTTGNADDPMGQWKNLRFSSPKCIITHQFTLT